MSKTRGIVTSINRRMRQEEYEDEIKKKYYEKMQRHGDKYEEERYKTETQKRHDKHRRNQKRRASSVKLEVLPAKKIVAKPGTYFYGPLRKLVDDFKTMEDIYKYMTVGQLVKYEERDGKIWNIKTNKMAYDPSTGECNE
jgi:hypothetical protein